MPVVPVSQLSLMRKRRQLRELMESGQWDQLLEMESELFSQINLAVSDPERSSRELLSELGSIIRLYRELSECCSLYGTQHINDEV